jgi:hypothetical protein
LILILVGTLMTTLGSVERAIGTSLIAAGVAGLIVFGWVVFDEVEAQRRKNLADFGLTNVWPYRSIQIKNEYVTRVSAAQTTIDIMGYGLNALREDFLGDFATWAVRAKVRILLVEPGAAGHPNYADQRDQEEGSPVGKIRGEVEKFVEDTAILRTSAPDRFEVRYAKTLPSVNMFRVDNEIFWGPYLVSPVGQGRTSRNLPTMMVRRPGYMFDRLAEHFDEIWSNPEFSETIS